MTSLARTEREALCDLALRLGPDAPTLSGDWTVKDLVVHLLVREGSPAAVGIVVSPLSRLTDLASAKLAREELPVLVERLRQGPPLWSPFRPAPLDRMLNTLEFYVHHEDVRRAQQSWEPRDLDRRVQEALWKAIRVAGKGLARSAPVGLVLERTDADDQRVVTKYAPGTVTVLGPPSELVLFAYGRQAQAKVEMIGTDDDIALLTGANLGI